MTFRELLRAVRLETGVPAVRVRRVAIEMLAQIQAAIARGEEVAIRDFGTFRVQHVPGRLHTNFRSRELVRSPAQAKVRFKPAGKTRRAASAARKGRKR